ncbi:MAG TPA: hypothetical protein PLL26_02900 [Candidatus Dojkabacteria bacterium]|nr:hypothetical protein [Candidatus Dojkabacteria bacterium]
MSELVENPQRLEYHNCFGSILRRIDLLMKGNAGGLYGKGSGCN